VAAGKIAAKTGARLLCDTFAPRLQRGAGRVPVERLPYFPEFVDAFLQGTEVIILVGAKPPVSFFAYRNRDGWLTPTGCRLAVLAHPHEDGAGAIEALVEACGATGARPVVAKQEPPPLGKEGPLSAESVMAVVARHLPEHAIIADESATSGFPHYGLTATAAPHDYLNLAGGSVGSMMPVSIGAAIACPGRKVVTLQGDGNGMYALQSLWTQARERLDVTTVIFANRSYNILHGEMKRLGLSPGGAKATSLVRLEDPTIGWVDIAKGLGVEAVRAEMRSEFEASFARAMREPGPVAIEAVI
jgi:acetolactate synthase-1/2/3 large subunit